MTRGSAKPCMTWGVVGRPIIDHDDLEVGETLREHGFDRFPDEMPAVVGGQDHTDNRTGGSCRTGLRISHGFDHTTRLM
jgi:hypothetical protein